MDDFLHNLRKNTERNYDRRNKQYNSPHNNPQYRGPERRGPRDNQRRPYQKRNELQEMMTEMTPAIKALLVNIEAGQQKLIEATQRQVDAQERQADSLETIAIVLQRLTETSSNTDSLSGPLTYAPETPPLQATNDGEQLASPIIVDRDQVVQVVVRLRDDGMTYKEIAQRLENDHIPTFSGKGAWHAQTVHKVCKRGL